VWEIAWGTMCDDEDCPQRLVRSVIVPLRTALRMLEDHRSKDPEAARGASMEKIKASIKIIRIMNVNNYRLCECTLKDGRLTLMPSLISEIDNPLLPVKGFTSEEIEWAVREALDLNVGPAIKGAEAAVAGFIKDCDKDIGFTPRVTVDWDSFRAIVGGQDALNAIGRFKDLLKSVHYSLFHLKKKVPFGECLESLHFRNVESVEQRAIMVDGMRITFSVPMIERSTCYSDQEIEDLLTDLVNELPVPETEEVVEEEEVLPEETEDTVEPEEKVFYLMNRNDADVLVDIYGRHRATSKAQLNEHNLILFLWEGGQIYMEYIPEEQRLVCGAKIHRFPREIHHNYVDALRAKADRCRDTGGGELVLDPVSKGIFLRRSWNDMPSDQKVFCEEVDRLATAGLVWMEQVYGEVVFPIMAKEKEMERK